MLARRRPICARARSEFRVGVTTITSASVPVTSRGFWSLYDILGGSLYLGPGITSACNHVLGPDIYIMLHKHVLTPRDHNLVVVRTAGRNEFR